MFKNYGYKFNWEGLGDVYSISKYNSCTDTSHIIIHNSDSLAFYVNHVMIHVLGTFFVSVAGMAYTCL